MSRLFHEKKKIKKESYTEENSAILGGAYKVLPWISVQQKACLPCKPAAPPEPLLYATASLLLGKWVFSLGIPEGWGQQPKAPAAECPSAPLRLQRGRACPALPGAHLWGTHGHRAPAAARSFSLQKAGTLLK